VTSNIEMPAVTFRHLHDLLAFHLITGVIYCYLLLYAPVLSNQGTETAFCDNVTQSDQDLYKLTNKELKQIRAESAFEL
jgi:hypothetical protein